MRKLGDHFPDEDKMEYVRRQVAPGHVLCLFCEFTVPPKEKYLAVVSAEPRPLLFVVNSSVGEFVRQRPDLLKCQVLLSAADYGFLTHDSYLDCSNVIDCIDQNVIAHQVTRDIGRIKGDLNGATRARVVEVVRQAKTISPRHKAAIEDALK